MAVQVKFMGVPISAIVVLAGTSVILGALGCSLTVECQSFQY